MTPHAHGGASAWNPTYATTPRVDYDDDDGPSSFATLNLTTPSYSHLTDALASGLGSSSSNNSSSTLSSNSNSLLNSSDGPTSVSSNHPTSTYSPYSNHPIASPATQLDYQRKIFINYIDCNSSLSLKIAYSSHIPTPGGIGSSFSSSSSSNHPNDQSSAANYVYSQATNLAPITPSAQYAPMSSSLGLFICFFSFFRRKQTLS